MLRKVYKTIEQQPSFYTGGPIKIGGNNQNLCFCTYGDVINVLELQTGKVLHTIKGDEQPITTLDVHQETNQILFSTFSRLVYLLSRNEHYEEQISDPAFQEKSDEEKALITPWKVQKKWKSHERPLIDISFDSTGAFCATASADRTAKVWNIQQGFCTHNFKGHTGVVSLVRFHPDPNKLQLFTASDDCTVRVWDLITKSCKVLKSHMSQVTSFGFSKSGWELVTGGRDRVLTVWDLRKAEAIKTIPVFESVEALVAVDNSKSKLLKNSNDTHVITAGDKGTLRLWNTRTGESLLSEAQLLDSQFLQISTFKGEMTNQFLAVNSDHNILAYHFDEIFERKKIICGFNDEILDIKYTNGGSHIAVATNCNNVKLYNLETMDCKMLLGHSDTVVCIDTNKDGTIICTSSKDNTVRVWDTSSLQCIGECTGHTESVGAVCFAKKSNEFIVSGSQDKTIKLWDIKKATKQLTKAVNPLVAIKCKTSLTIKAHDKEINTVAVAPNDSMIATGSQDALLKLWDKQSLNLIATLKGHKRGVWSVEFSRIDKCIASASADHTIKIWSLVDFTCLKTFEGHGNSVLKVKFISAGLQLLSCGSDAVIKLWNIKTSECVNTFDNHEDRVWALATKDDGNEFVSGGSDSLINFWKDVTAEEEEEAMKLKEGVILKEQQLSNFIHEKKYQKAIFIAFELDKPNRIYNLFEELIDHNNIDQVDQLLKSISKFHLVKCFSYLRDWNTISKQSQLAQFILSRILVLYTPDELIKLPHIKEVLLALMSYSERHYQRIDSLLQKSYIIEFSLQQMSVTTDLISMNRTSPKQLQSNIPQLTSNLPSSGRYFSNHIIDDKNEDLNDEESIIISDTLQDGDDDNNNNESGDDSGDRRTNDVTKEEKTPKSKKQKAKNLAKSSPKTASPSSTSPQTKAKSPKSAQKQQLLKKMAAKRKIKPNLSPQKKVKLG